MQVLAMLVDMIQELLILVPIQELELELELVLVQELVQHLLIIRSIKINIDE
jgi:hypothetical protein